MSALVCAMHMKYATLERFLVRLFNMSESQRGALKGKFKYLNRLGNAGEIGRASGPARYQLDEILRFVIYFQLLAGSCRPAIALRWVRTHWTSIEAGLLAAWQEVAEPDRYPTRNQLWVVMPNVLSEAGSGESLLTTTIVEPAGNVSPDALLEWRRPAADANRCAIMIHFPMLLASCCEALAGIEPDLERRFRGAMNERVAAIARAKAQ